MVKFLIVLLTTLFIKADTAASKYFFEFGMALEASMLNQLKQSSESDLSILWWNISCGYISDDYSKLKDTPLPMQANIAGILRTEQAPDVLILGEFCNVKRLQAFKHKLFAVYPYHSHLKRTIDASSLPNGILVLSKKRIKNVKKPSVQIEYVSEGRPKNVQRRYLDFALKVGDRWLKVVALHLPNPLSLNKNPFLLVSHKHPHYSFSEKVIKSIDKNGGADIVVGDFNTSSFMASYKLWRDSYRDNSLMGSTYPTQFSMNIANPASYVQVQIDRLFFSSHISCITRTLHGLVGSDHYPILSRCDLD